jgi:hypothetical protein
MPYGRGLMYPGEYFKKYSAEGRVKRREMEKMKILQSRKGRGGNNK